MGDPSSLRHTPLELRALENRLQVEFPELHLHKRKDIVVVTGAFPLVDDQRVVDRYMIELELPKDHPKGIPVLRETAHRIPLTHDRHMNNNGTACLFVPDEYVFHHPEGMGLVEFLKGPVLGFLVGQSLVEQGRPWPFGTRSHYAAGIVEFYGDIVGCSAWGIVRRYLTTVASRDMRGHWLCPCGSRRRIRACHLAQLRDLRNRIPREIAQQSLESLDRERTAYDA